MSFSSELNSGPPNNPYDAPQAYQDPARRPQQPTPFPVYCTVIFIIDLVLLGLRALLVLLGIVGLIAISNMPEAQQDPMVMQTAAAEIASGACMVLFGGLAAIFLLMRQRWAVVLAYLKIVAVLGSIAVGLWQITFTIEQFNRPEEKMGAMIGAGVVVLIRLTLIGAYAFALHLFVKWHNQSAAMLRSGY